MDMPPSLASPFTTVCKLKKYLYKLRQSLRVWHKRLSSKLKEGGYGRCSSYHSIFNNKTDRGDCIVVVYVDDPLVIGSNKTLILKTKKVLQSVFEMKDLGELRYFLGMKVTKTNQWLFLNQKKCPRIT